MTRKHFEAIAITIGHALREHDPNGPEYRAILDTTADLAGTFKQINPAFDFDRFGQFVVDVAQGRRGLDGKKVAA